MKRTSSPIHFAGTELRDSRHICAFFNDEEEEYATLIPFIKDGFENGDKAIHIVNPEQREEHFRRLSSAGIDLTTEQSGQLDIRNNVDVYLSDGRFDKDLMFEVFGNLAGGDGEFTLSRIICRMDWVSEKKHHFEDLMEFESRINGLWACHDDAVICTYHLGKFGGEAVVDVMRTHPMIIIGGVLQHNPFFVPPEVFLKEKYERRTRLNSASPATS
jgi:hypothetical protein